MAIWWLISHLEVHTSWTKPILAYLHAPKNCMSSCIHHQFGLLSQKIACICNFYTHATCWWWVSLNFCGPQECCRGDENIFIFVCIKMGCPPSNLIGIQKNRIWTTVTAHHICNFLDNFLIQQTLIFFSIAALWPWFECASFEYTHQAHSSNLNFHFFKILNFSISKASN